MSFPVHIRGDRLGLSREIQAGTSRWNIPEEVPIAVVFNRRNYAVMMGTPDDVVDFGTGFTLTEGVVKDISEIKSLDVIFTEQGVDLRFKIMPDAVERLELTLRRRNLVGSASCGLCGLENADVLFQKLPQVSDIPLDIDSNILEAALRELRAHQPLNAKTHSVHAAAWVNMDGSIKFVREDVGRHNALDKLLGCISRNKVDIKQGFALMSSRCSYEIVEKAARMGVRAILSVSGPTAFALRKAQEANMAIYCRAENSVVRLL